MDRVTELKVLREDLMNELDAINLYQAHIDVVIDPAAKELLTHIRDEEKEHVAELMAIIRRLDPEQEEAFAAEHSEALISGRGITSEGLPERSPSIEPEDKATEETSSELTIGNMVGE